MALALAAFVLFPLGCNKGEQGSDVVAKVNSKKILRSEVDKYYKNQTAGSPEQLSDEQASSLRLSILQQLINNEIMMQRAEKLGLLATDEEVDAKFTEIKAPYTQEEFKKRLEERSINEEDFKRDLRRNLTIDKVMNKEITSKITISDADISGYYNAHKAEFNLVVPQYHMAQILVTTTPDPQVSNLKNSKAQNEAEARRKVQELENRLETGEDFANLAMNYSEQPNTAGNGGDLGFTPEPNLKQDPEAYDVVSKMHPGQVSGVIPIYDPPKSKRLVGFRIIKLISREPAGQRDLNDPRVQQAIREQLRDRREQLLKAAYYEVVRNEAKVEDYFAEDVLKRAGQK